MKPSRDIAALLDIMARLRTAVTGCPWDLEQDFASIAPYTIEEAYEVADAIERGDLDDLKDELGDLLLQVVFHARMAEEAGRFGFGDVVEAITAKMIRRHPHVFGDADARDAAAVKRRWDAIKSEEKAERAARHQVGTEQQVGLLDEVPLALPALTRAVKLQKRAGTVGFDMDDPYEVLGKVREELDELQHELDGEMAKDRLEDELGDVLFALANLARHLQVDPESALRRSSNKFHKRFRYIEMQIRRGGRGLKDASRDKLEELWIEAKRLDPAP